MAVSLDRRRAWLTAAALSSALGGAACAAAVLTKTEESKPPPAAVRGGPEGWSTLPTLPAGATAYRGTPALVADPASPQTMELWVAGAADGRLHHLAREAGRWGERSTPEEIALPGGAVWNGSVAVASRGRGALGMAATSGAGEVFYRAREGAGWQGWEPVPLGGKILRSAALSAVGGEVQVWAVRAGVPGLAVARRTGGRWAEAVALGGPAGAGIEGAPVVHVRGQYVDIVVRAGGDLHHTVYDTVRHAAGAWASLGHPGAGLSPTVEPAVAARGHVQAEAWAVDAGGAIFRKRWSPGAGWEAAWSEASRPTSAAGLATPVEALVALYRGDGPGHEIDLAVIGGDHLLHHRAWRASAPAPVVAQAPDRGLEGTYHDTYPAGCNGIALWENTSAIIPPHTAGCGAQGKFFLSLGHYIDYDPRSETEVWKGNLSCLEERDGGAAGDCAGSGSPACPMTNYDVRTTDAGYPAGYQWHSSTPGWDSTKPWIGSGDNQMVRVRGTSAALPNQGSLLLLRQTSVIGSPGSPRVSPGEDTCITAAGGQQLCRGTEMFYRSTDCGQSWHVTTVIDPCDPARDNAYGCEHDTSGGMDYPFLALDPAHPADVWMTVTTRGDAPASSVSLYHSEDYGGSWKVENSVDTGPIHNLPQGVQTIVAVGDTIFVLGLEDSTATDENSLYLRWLSPVPGGRLLTKYMGDALPTYEVAHFAQVPSRLYFSPIGQYGQDYYMRTISPVIKKGRQSYRIRVLKVVPSTRSVTVVAQSDLDATNPQGSVLHLTMVDQDRIELTDKASANAALAYWYETDQTPTSSPAHVLTSSDFGPTRIKGCILRDADAVCERFPLSTRIGPAGQAVERTFPGFLLPGDYTGGAFYFDTADTTGRPLKFLAQWVETPGLTPAGTGASQALHANIVSVAP